MGYFGPYQVYKIEGLETVARVSDWDKLNVSVNNAVALAESNAKAYTDGKDTDNRSAWAAADAVLAAKQAVKAVRLEAGKWVWDLAGATHYVIPDHTGALIVRPTAQPVPAATPALDW